MFEDLDDPNPPTAGIGTLAKVTERARRLRRRRAVFVGSSAGVLVVAATIGALIVTNNNNDDGGPQLVNISAPGGPSETAAETVLHTDPIATASSVSSPSSDPLESVAPPSDAPSVTDGSSDSAVVGTTPESSSPPGSSDLVIVTATTEPAITTTVPPATTIVAPSTRPIVAINGGGDAVVLDSSATLTTFLYDGTDPDDPPPSEGEVIVVDAVAATNDGALAFVGTCCEPVPGTVLRFALPDTSTLESAFGHAPALSPDETKVAVDVLGSVSVFDLNLVEIASTAEDFLVGSGIGIVWVDNANFVVLTADGSENRLQLVTLGPDGTLVAGPTAAFSLAGDAFAASLAGTGDGVIYVRGLSPATISAFDIGTFEPVTGEDVALPSESLSAWMQDGELRWIDLDRQLHVGDTVVPGEYIWVR